MDLNQIEQLIIIAKKHGIHFFKTREIEFAFPYEDSKPTVPTIAEGDSDDLLPKPSFTEGMPGDDEMLVYSTPAFDEIQAQRAEAQVTQEMKDYYSKGSD